MKPSDQSRVARNYTRPHQSAGARRRQRYAKPMVLVFSSDDSLSRLVKGAVSAHYEVERCDNVVAVRASLQQSLLKVVIFDDDGVEKDTRGWVQAQIRRSAPDALKVYVASAHSAEGERRARARGAHYYTAKPIDRQQFLRVVRSFLEAQ